MTRPLLGEGFLPIEFTRTDNILGYDLYLVGSSLPLEIGMAELGKEVEMGDCLKVKNHEVVYSVGANPCLIVVAITRAQVPWVLHTTGEGLDTFQEKTIKNSVGGIAGGGPEMIRDCVRLLERFNIRILRSYDPKADFNVVVVRKKIKDIPQGIHYGYGNVSDEN